MDTSSCGFRECNLVGGAQFHLLQVYVMYLGDELICGRDVGLSPE